MIIKNYDPKDIGWKMLYEEEHWGAIELNLDLDVDKLQKYYSDVKKNLSYVF